MGAARTEAAWLDEVRAALARGDAQAAQAMLAAALAEHPGSSALRRTQAGLLQRAGQRAQAETLLRAALDADPGDAGAAFALARQLQDQGRVAAAAATLVACLRTERQRGDAELAIAAIERLDDCDRKRDAAAIAAGALVQHPDDARLHAYAGMLAVQLGEFERAREHDLFALAHDPRAWEWHVPLGLSATQRYASAAHPDFALFREGLRRAGLSAKARAELNFALGKAHDDIADYAAAADYFRQGNQGLHALTRWSRKAWRRTVEARLAAAPLAVSAEPADGFTPIFIVGMPRSGTTLLAELLSRAPDVCNRGEQPWIAQLAGQPALAGAPDARALAQAADTYAMQTRRDDAEGARWFIDKQPLNFRYVDLMLALFPHARVIHCQRDAADTALSLWTQCFLEAVQGYSYDFDDIALVLRDCDRLMAHWRQRFPAAIRGVRYEDLVAAPDAIVGELAAWIGLAPGPRGAASPAAPRAISTASLWQARQPVHARSVRRAARYLAHVPELGRWVR